MPSLSVTSPVRADHRFLKKVVSVILGGKVESRPSEFSMISRAFVQVGGSWERIFKGSPQDVHLLKRIVRRAYKLGLLTKIEPWGARD
jgi:hypothetical protein